MRWFHVPCHFGYRFLLSHSQLLIQCKRYRCDWTYRLKSPLTCDRLLASASLGSLGFVWGWRNHTPAGLLKGSPCCNHLKHGVFHQNKGNHHLQVAMFRCFYYIRIPVQGLLGSQFSRASRVLGFRFATSLRSARCFFFFFMQRGRCQN